MSERGRGVRAVEAEGRSSAPPERVFAVLEDAPGWKAWAGFPVAEYVQEGTPAPHGVGAIRRFGNKLTSTREEVLVHEPPRHLAYRIVSGVPVEGYRADVTLTPDGDGTAIRWAATFRPKVPGTGWILEPFLASFLRRFVKGLARHAES
jgi:uncharacterized protein YndB with AHSA1/START domain